MPDLNDDYVQLLQSVIGAAAVIGAVLVTALIAWLTRLHYLLHRMDARDRLNWMYIQELMTHSIEHAPGVPLPDPPEGWAELNALR